MSIGKTLKKIRENKGFARSDVAGEYLTVSNLGRIERDEQVPAVDNFFALLSHLNVSLDEFSFLGEDNDVCIRSALDPKISEAIRLRNFEDIHRLEKEAKAYYEKYKMSYFLHAEIRLRAFTLLYDNEFDSAKTRKAVGKRDIRVIREYLTSIKKWHYYEIILAIDLLHFFEIEEALELGQRAIDAIEENFLHYKDKELAAGILINLTYRALEDEKYLMKAYGYISYAIGLPTSTRTLSSNVYAKALHQIVCYKLNNDQYSKPYLSSLVNWYLLAGVEANYQELKNFAKEHGIDLDHSAKVYKYKDSKHLREV